MIDRRHFLKASIAGGAALAFPNALSRLLIPAVPSSDRHPHFEPDLGIARRLRHGLDDAACGYDDRRRPTRATAAHRSFGDYGGRRHRGMRQCERCEALTRALGGDGCLSGDQRGAERGHAGGDARW